MLFGQMKTMIAICVANYILGMEMKMKTINELQNNRINKYIKKELARAKENSNALSI